MPLKKSTMYMLFTTSQPHINTGFAGKQIATCNLSTPQILFKIISLENVNRDGILKRKNSQFHNSVRTPQAKLWGGLGVLKLAEGKAILSPPCHSHTISSNL